MLRLLVTGCHGQLGHELRRLIDSGVAEIGPVPDAYLECMVDYVDIESMDITNYVAVRKWFASHGPYDVVFNCAAFTSVDACEREWKAAFSVNAIGPMNLAYACATYGTKLVHVSTDYVFSGADQRPRLETDVPNPISAYGRTKLSGEGLALSANPRTFIVRTAWLYGYVGRNFVKTMLRLESRHDVVTVVDDQLGNPTSANDLAYELLNLALTDSYGIYHCTNEGICSWADFAEAIMIETKAACKVIRCSSEQYAIDNPESAKRPAFSALENSHLETTIGNEMRPWREALASFLKNLEGITE